MNKHKLFLVVGSAIALVAIAVYADVQIKDTVRGLSIGTKASDKIGFYGATPVVQGSLTNTAASLFTIIGPTSGTTADVVTNATIDVATVATNVASTTVTGVTNIVLQTAEITYLGPGLTTNTVTVVTNAVVTTTDVVDSVTAEQDTQGVTLETQSVFADITGSATNTFAAYATTNQANAIVTVLRNLGLAQ